MRLGVDAANLPRDHRGMGRYVRNVLRQFATRHAERVHLTMLVPDLLPQLTAKRYIGDLPGDVVVARRADAGKLGFDLVWYPWNGMTWVATGRKVATVHDCWPFVSPAKNAAIRRNEQTPFLRTAENADCIITDSAFGKAEVMTHLRVPPSRIQVVPLGVDPAPAAVATLSSDGSASTDGRDTRATDQRYILFVGEAEKRKDLATLLAAMALLPESLRDTVTLTVVGRVQPDSAGPVPAGARVSYKGEVSDTRLASLYAGASVFVLPSIYEGFGLPLLEAMSFGIPVVASDAASIPEVADKAALYFPARDAQALAVAIEMMLTDDVLASRFRTTGLARAAEMTWDRCADKTLEIFERVASSS